MARSFYKSITEYGNSIAEVSILGRPGAYIGTYELNNSKIKIVRDCIVDTDAAFSTINNDPPVIFKNIEFPVCLMS